MEINFLSLARVLKIHRASVEVFGGDPSVRDMGLLESAIAQPRATFGGQYFHEDMASKAAAYCFHIVSNHPFVDGNKRTGALAALMFLRVNHVRASLPEDEYQDMVLAVARGKATKDGLNAFFRKYVKE